MKINIILSLCILFMTSCYSTKPVYKSNVHSQSIGKSKNQILRTYGVPQRTEGDGENGSIMIFEKSVETTVTNVGTTSRLNSGTNAGAVYGGGGIIAGSRTQGNVIANTNAISRTSTDVQFLYLFLDSSLKVYDFKSNYGAEYDYIKCFDNLTTTYVCLLSVCCVFPAPIVIPWAIIAKKKAIKRGLPLCY
jgi:hypothetical protein